MAAKKKPGKTKRKADKKPAKRSAAKTARPRSAGGEPEEISLWRQIIAYRDVLEKSATGWANYLADERRGHDRVLEDIPEAERDAYRELWKRSAAERNAPIALDRLQAFHDRLHSFKGKSGDYTIVQLRAAAELFRNDMLSEAVISVVTFIKDPDELTRAYALAALVAARDSTPRAIDTSEVERILRPHDFADRIPHATEPDLMKLLEEAKARRTLKNNSYDTVASNVVAAALGMPPHSRKLKLRS